MTTYDASGLVTIGAGAESREMADYLQYPTYNLEALVLDFTWSPNTPTVVSIGSLAVTVPETVINEVITFTATSVTSPNHYIVTYIWDFGDGTVLQASDVVEHTFLVANYQDRVRLFTVGKQVYLTS